MKLISNSIQIAFLFAAALMLFTACDQKKDSSSAEDLTWTTDSEDALNSLLVGLAYQDVNDNISSRKYLNEAIDSDPNFAIAYVFRSYSSGSASEFKADTDKAVSLMESANEGEKLLIKINQTYLTSDDAGRLELMKQLTELYPNSARAWYLLAFEQDARNDPQAARENYSKSQQLDPSWVGAYTSAGSSYLFSEPKDYDAAQTNFMKAAEIAPDYAFSHINLGDAYRAKNDLENAAASYTKALEIDPEHFVAYTKRGHANSFLGNYEDARSDYQASREFAEYGDQAFTFEAFTYIYEGDVGKSLAWLEEQANGLDASGLPADRISAGKFQCANSCAWIAFHHGKTDHLDRLKEMRNNMQLDIVNDIGTEQATINAKANNAFWDGLTAAMKGDYETATMKAEENSSLLAEMTDPNKLFSYNFLMGYINFEQGNNEAAEQYFRDGNPNWIYNSYYLGKTLMKTGKTEEGKTLLQNAALNNFNTVHYALIRNELLEGT